MITFETDEEKTIEVMLYITSVLVELDARGVFAIMYLSDKWHLDNYGRLIANNSYIALKDSPVPVLSYPKVIEGLLSNFEIVDAKILPLRYANQELFSESDILALDVILDKSKNNIDLLNKSRDSAWEKTKTGSVISIEDIVATFDSPNDLLDYLTSGHN